MRREDSPDLGNDWGDDQVLEISTVVPITYCNSQAVTAYRVVQDESLVREEAFFGNNYPPPCETVTELPRKSREWDSVEDDLLLGSFRLHGNDWRKIAAEMPGRTQNAIKSRLQCVLQRMDENWTDKEDFKLISLKTKYKGDWESIVSRFPSRKVHALRARWRIIDPRKQTSSPRLEVVSKQSLPSIPEDDIASQNVDSQSRKRCFEDGPTQAFQGENSPSYFSQSQNTQSSYLSHLPQFHLTVSQISESSPLFGLNYQIPIQFYTLNEQEEWLVKNNQEMLKFSNTTHNL